MHVFISWLLGDIFYTDALAISVHLGWFLWNLDDVQLNMFITSTNHVNYKPIQFPKIIICFVSLWLDLIIWISFACFSMNMRILQRIFHPAKILNPFLTLGWSAKYSFSEASECFKSWWGQTLFGVIWFKLVRT